MTRNPAAATKPSRGRPRRVRPADRARPQAAPEALAAHVKLGEGGRLVIPAAFRKALGIEPGDRVVMLLEDGKLRLMSGQAALDEARALVRKYIPAGISLSEELIAERRAEARRE